MVERLLGFGTTIVLARMLAPSDFGLVAMAMVVVSAADLLGNFGLDWALIRQPELRKAHLDTAWTIRFILGVVSFVLLVALARPAAEFYDEPRIAAMIVVMGIALLIGSLENPGFVIYRREMDFQKEFIIRVVSKLALGIVSVGVALVYKSYWALLLGMLVARAVATFASYVMHPHRPSFTLETRAELLGFSIWLWLANLLFFLRTKIVELVIGRVAGARELGIFSVANDLSLLASSELAGPINRALYSEFAKNASDDAMVGASYLRTAHVVWAVTLPIVVLVFLAAPQLIYFLLGAKWAEAAPVLRLLSIAAFFNLLSTGATQVYWAINRTSLEVSVEAIWVVVILAFVVILTPAQGLLGAALAITIGNALLVPVNVLLLRRYAAVSVRMTIGGSWRVHLACGSTGLMGYALFGTWRPSGSLEALTQGVAIASFGATVYGCLLFGLWWLCGAPEGPERILLAKARAALRWMSAARPLRASGN